MPLFTSNFSSLGVEPGTPTGSLLVHDPNALPAAQRINTTAQTGVDAYGQAAALPLAITTDVNGSTAIQSQNLNTGANASMDIVATAPTGDYFTGPFIDLGITNDNYNNPLFTIGQVAGYLFTVGYELQLGTASEGADVLMHSGGTLASNERVRINSHGAIYNQTKVSHLYDPNIEAQFPGDLSIAGTATIRNWGYLGTFTGATVPALASATYDLDVTIDGGSNHPLAIALLNTDSWTSICSKIQTALRAATSSTETVTIVAGEITITSATTGTSSSVIIAPGTAGSGGGDLLAAIRALPATGTIALDSTRGNLFAVTPAGNITFNIATVPIGQRITFIFTTSGVTPYTMTFGSNIKSQGTLVTGVSSGKVFTVEFLSDGTNFNEISRTAAM